MNLEGKVSREPFLLEVGLGKNEIVDLPSRPSESQKSWKQWPSCAASCPEDMKGILGVFGDSIEFFFKF